MLRSGVEIIYVCIATAAVQVLDLEESPQVRRNSELRDELLALKQKIQDNT